MGCARPFLPIGHVGEVLHVILGRRRALDRITVGEQGLHDQVLHGDGQVLHAPQNQDPVRVERFAELTPRRRVDPRIGIEALDLGPNGGGERLDPKLRHICFLFVASRPDSQAFIAPAGGRRG